MDSIGMAYNQIFDRQKKLIDDYKSMYEEVVLKNEELLKEITLLKETMYEKEELLKELLKERKNGIYDKEESC